MVRNTNGGCKSKGFARKLQDSSSASEPLRLPTDECEIFATVKKILGNGRLIVGTMNSAYPELQCMIRSKFRGRSKRNHMVTVGSVLLIGLHHWETPNYKHSDMLHIYPSSSLSQLLHMKLIPSSFITSSVYDSAGTGDDSFTFENTDHTDIDLPPPNSSGDRRSLKPALRVSSYFANPSELVIGRLPALLPQRIPDMKLSGGDVMPDFDDI
jgi:translation initiation factor IF-1